MHEFYIAGVKFHEAKKCLHLLNKDDELELVQEPDNQYDQNAVQIIANVNDKRYMLGYVPGKLSAEISAWIESTGATCKIIEVDPSAKTWQQILVGVE